MNRQYESVVIINASLEDEQIEAVITRVQEYISSNDGEIVNIESWGRKRLAYPIQKSKSGFYVIIRFSAPTGLIAKLERVLRLDEKIIRYLTILLDKKAIEFYEQQKKKLAEVPVENIETETDENVKSTVSEE